MKIIFKQDTKRFQDFTNYQDLVEETQKAFDLTKADIISKTYKFYYIDNEGDVISITSQEDYYEACAIFPNGKLKLILSDCYQTANQALTNLFDQSFSSIHRSSSVAGFSTQRAMKGPDLAEDKDKMFGDQIDSTTVSLGTSSDSNTQMIECYKCDGTKVNNKGKKVCKACRGKGFFTTQYEGNIKSMIQEEVAKITASQKFKNEMDKKVEKAKAVHQYTCDGCKVTPIRGIRYRCSKREDYDLCEKCEHKMAKDLPYPMWKIREPKHMAMSIMCQYAEQIVLQVEQREPAIQIAELKVSSCEQIQQNLKGSAVPESDQVKMDYMKQCESIQMTEEMKVKMLQLMNMGLFDFNSNLIALFQSSGLLDVACSTIMKNGGGEEE